MQRFALLLILLLTVAFAGLPSCSHSDDADVLFIYSPHGADIQYEFTRGFEEWHLKKYGRAVHVKFIDAGGGGGTGNIIDRLNAQRKSGVAPDADIMFGGGSAVFDDLGRRGFLEVANPPLPDSLVAQLPADINGVPVRRTLADLMTSTTGPASQPSSSVPIWYAATTSYFGIVVNKQRAAELSIPLPVMWEDVAGPKWFGNLSVADPSKSGSMKSALEMMLQQYGWEKGWPILMKMFANAETVKPGGSQPADEVSSAAAVGGVVIDFYGRIAAVKCGPEIAQFIVPQGGAVIDPDPIAVLAGAKHKELASHMLEFVLSPEGQRLWTHRAGTPGGPAKKALGRMTTLKSLYDNEGDLMTDPFSPFSGKADLKVDRAVMRDRTVVLGDLIKAALVDNHDLLVEARKAIMDAGDPPELLALFDSPDALPFKSTELTDLVKKYHDDKYNAVRGWNGKYKALFESIIAKAKSYKSAH